MSTASPSHDEKDYEPLFRYGPLRANYLNSDLSSGRLHINNMLRAEHLEKVRAALTADVHILGSRNNTAQQTGLSPVARQFLWELQSGIMLRVLENITTLHNLLPDPHCHDSVLLMQDRDRDIPVLWRDPATSLTCPLKVLIELDDGSATICTDHENLLASLRGNQSLFLATYWQHGSETVGGNT